jgi:hypothetical protein
MKKGTSLSWHIKGRKMKSIDENVYLVIYNNGDFEGFVETTKALSQEYRKTFEDSSGNGNVEIVLADCRSKQLKIELPAGIDGVDMEEYSKDELFENHPELFDDPKNPA